MISILKNLIPLSVTFSNYVLANNADGSLNLIRATIDEETRLRIKSD